MKRKLDGDPVSEIAGLMGPLGLPGALAGMAAKLGPEELTMLHELLGKPIKMGQKLLRLSSGDPQKNRGILHYATGERVATPLDDFLAKWKTLGEDTAEIFPEGAVVSAPGIKAPQAAIGARGGPIAPKKRLK